MPDNDSGSQGDQGTGGTNNDAGTAGGTGSTGSTGNTGNAGAAGGSDDGGRGGKEQLLADLARERDRRQAAEREAKRTEAELAKLRESSMSDQEKAIEQARREARAEANGAFNKRLVQADVRAAAAGKLTDPEDAIRFLDLDTFAVNDDGETDKKAITAAVAQLVKDKPYLAAGATRPTGDADQGARGAGAGSSSMNDLIRNAIRR